METLGISPELQPGAIPAEGVGPEFTIEHCVVAAWRMRANREPTEVDKTLPDPCKFCPRMLPDIPDSHIIGNPCLTPDRRNINTSDYKDC